MARLEKRKSVGTLLADASASRGDATFLFFEEREIGYREMYDEARSVASGLAALGMRSGDRLALLLPNVPEFLTAWFGAALAGVVVVPINPAFKREELRYILKNCGASGIVTTPERRDDVEAIGGGLPALQTRLLVGAGPIPRGWRALAALASEDSTAPLEVLSPDDPAAIIYTSGTTGHPKGVVLTHANYHFDTWSLTTHLATTPRDRFLCFLPLFHVNAQVVSVLSAVLSGGGLILLREFKPQQFFETIARHRATTFSAVPTVYAILNTLPEADRHDLSSLRYCVCGAAPMPVEVFETFERKFDATIVEGYGLSEATCGNCVNPVGENEVRKIGSIGIPLPGQEMAIVDDEGRPLPDGQIGEIVIRGDAVMKEYFANPEATAEALAGGWLHTGDLGTRDADGYYFVVGRKKEMIIRGGENIYPKEIEEVIYRHPDVQEAAVIGIPDEVWGEIVCACVVPKENASPSVDAIRALCAENLADFKVPVRVELFASFPKTATGKIQKNKITFPSNG